MITATGASDGDDTKIHIIALDQNAKAIYGIILVFQNPEILDKVKLQQRGS